MSSDPCDGCGEEVRIGGGAGTLWTFEEEATGGMALELADGTDVFLCFDCIDRLPDDREVTAADVESLPPGEDRDE
jgi:hypothetical protein